MDFSGRNPLNRFGSLFFKRHPLLTGGLPLGLSLMAGLIFYTDLPGRSHSGPLPPLTEQERVLRRNLKAHVDYLAGEIGERNLSEYEELKTAARYIRETLSRFGYRISDQAYTARGKIVRNIEAVKPGVSMPEKILVMGAHYDSVFGSPGANDNGSAVAALLETARLLAEDSLAKTIRFVAFVNEEPPFFQTDLMGSRVYARRCRENGDDIIGMISLETIGFYSDEPGSQKYPFPLGMLYPDTGDFIGFVSNLGSKSFLDRCIRAFRNTTDFPSEGTAAPGWMTGIGWSDHWAFWKEGYAGVMVTDTAPFRYPHYHTSRDTPDKIDYDRTARVTAGLSRMAAVLADAE